MAEAEDVGVPQANEEALKAVRDVEKRHVSVHFDCKCRDEDIARMAKELMDDPSLLDGNGGECCPPLLHAVIKEHPRCITFLLECGAEVLELFKLGAVIY